MPQKEISASEERALNEQQRANTFSEQVEQLQADVAAATAEASTSSLAADLETALEQRNAAQKKQMEFASVNKKLKSSVEGLKSKVCFVDVIVSVHLVSLLFN